MEAREYQRLAMRTNDGKCTERLCVAIRTPGIDIGGIVNASFGLSGETGELNDMIKKSNFHGHALNIDSVQKEIGDICWYIAMMCESFGFDLQEIMQINIDKLKARYPEGFSEEKSQHRQANDI